MMERRLGGVAIKEESPSRTNRERSRAGGTDDGPGPRARRRRHPRPPRLRAGAEPADGGVLELRALVLDHLHPGRRGDVVPPRLLRRRRRGDRAGVAARVPLRAGRGADDGAGRLGLPDGRRPLPLGRDPRRPRVGLGRRLAQPGGPGRRPGGDRRRGVRVRARVAGDAGRRTTGGRRSPLAQAAGVAAIVGSQAALEPPRGPPGRAADGPVGLPDPGRRGRADGRDARAARRTSTRPDW